MKNDRQYNDWHPETTALLRSLEREGFTIHSGNNGDSDTFLRSSFTTETGFLTNLLACDEATLYVSRTARDKHGNPRLYWMYLVLGNSPGELVCDHTIPNDTGDAEALDRAADAHFNEWDGKPQPMISEADDKRRSEFGRYPHA